MSTSFQEKSSPIEKPEGFNPDHFAHLFELEANYFWFVSRNLLIQWALSRFFKPSISPKGKFLEIGCGTGFVLSGLQKTFSAWQFSGSEFFQEGLSFAQKRLPHLPEVALFQLDARSMPFKNEFQVIGAFDVLEHIEEDTQVLKEMHRALLDSSSSEYPSGILLTVPQHPRLWSLADEQVHHVRRYTAKELRQKVEAAGFQICWMGSFVSLLLPLMIASRLKPSKKAAQEADVFAEFRLPSLVNEAFKVVMTIERWLIYLGLRFPVGGSLMLVAYKD